MKLQGTISESSDKWCFILRPSRVEGKATSEAGTEAPEDAWWAPVPGGHLPESINAGGEENVAGGDDGFESPWVGPGDFVEPPPQNGGGTLW